jgi:hypothetical protein
LWRLAKAMTAGLPLASTVVPGKLTIVPTYEASWATSADPTAWTACLANVIATLQNNLCCKTNVTLNITFGYGTVNGGPVGDGTQGTNVTPTNVYGLDGSYSGIRSAYQALNKNSAQAVAYNDTNFPASSFFPGASILAIPHCLEQAIGYSYTGIDEHAYVGIHTGTYDLTVDGKSCDGALYSLWGGLMHEITETMGRSCNNGVTYLPGDFWAYSSAGVRKQIGTGRYLSDDGGTTNLADFGNAGTGDTGDYAGGTHYGGVTPFTSYGTVGAIPNPMSPADWRYMTLLGWGLTPLGLTNAAL